MKKVQIQDFIDYRYLGSLQVSPDQQHAVLSLIHIYIHCGHPP